MIVNKGKLKKTIFKQISTKTISKFFKLKIISKFFKLKTIIKLNLKLLRVVLVYVIKSIFFFF